MISLDLRWFLFTLLALLLATGVIGYALGRGTAQRNLLQQMIVLSTPALDTAPAGVLIFTAQNRLLYANATALSLLGIDAKEKALPGALWEQLGEGSVLVDEEKGQPPRLLWHRLDFTMEVAGSIAPLTFWVVMISGTYIAIVQDASASLAGARGAQLLLGGLSHELRTPLATMATHAEILRNGDLPEQVREQSLRLINEEIKRLSRLISNAVELGRIESGIDYDLQPIDLTRIADEARLQMESVATTAGMTISLTAQTPLPLILGQPDRMKQVFLNLLDNAVKYGASNKPIEIVIKSTGMGIYCAVKDYGTGIPQEQIPLLKQRFYRATSDNISGNGLGLSIVEAILRQHGSRLQIVSIQQNELSDLHGEEQGTQVFFTLPWAGVAPNDA